MPMFSGGSWYNCNGTLLWGWNWNATCTPQLQSYTFQVANPLPTPLPATGQDKAGISTIEWNHPTLLPTSNNSFHGFIPKTKWNHPTLRFSPLSLSFHGEAYDHYDSDMDAKTEDRVHCFVLLPANQRLNLRKLCWHSSSIDIKLERLSLEKTSFTWCSTDINLTSFSPF